MVKAILNKLSNQRLEEILFHTLRAIYLFERSEIETFGLDYQQMYLLKILKRRHPLRVSDVAQELRIPVFAATRLIRQLESGGLVLKNRDSRDRRNVYIHMTEAGTGMVGRIESHITTLIMDRIAHYPAEQVGIILKVVRDLDMILGVPGDAAVKEREPMDDAP